MLVQRASEQLERVEEEEEEEEEEVGSEKVERERVREDSLRRTEALSGCLTASVTPCVPVRQSVRCVDQQTRRARYRCCCLRKVGRQVREFCHLDAVTLFLRLYADNRRSLTVAAAVRLAICGHQFIKRIVIWQWNGIERR